MKPIDQTLRNASVVIAGGAWLATLLVHYRIGRITLLGRAYLRYKDSVDADTNILF